MSINLTPHQLRTQGQAIALEVAQMLGASLSAWQTNPAPEWEYATLTLGSLSLTIGTSTGGVVSVNGDPFTPGDRQLNLNVKHVQRAVEHGLRRIAGHARLDTELQHAVIRFKRALDLPRFSMSSGERWGFVVFGKYAERLQKIKRGERFDFAGGQVLAEDVEIVYQGDCGLGYSLAAGYITDPGAVSAAQQRLAGAGA